MNSFRSDDRYPEGGIPRELRRPSGDRPTVDCCPMDVAGGEPARLEIRRYQQDPVERATENALPDGVEGIDLGQHMPPQGRVAPADDLDRPAQVQREQVTGHTADVSSTAAASGMLRVFVRMKQVSPTSARPAAYSAVSNTVTTDTSCTVCEPVGSSSRTAIRRPAATFRARIRSRAAGSVRTGGAEANTSWTDMPGPVSVKTALPPLS